MEGYEISHTYFKAFRFEQFAVIVIKFTSTHLEYIELRISLFFFIFLALIL